MNDRVQWLRQLGRPIGASTVGGLVLVKGYSPHGRPPEEVEAIEKAVYYDAHAVFFRADVGGKPPVAEAFIYVSDGPEIDPDFAELHRRLWSWGGVPLVYRKTRGLIQLFRCAHKPDFIKNGEIICNPVRTLKLVAEISTADAADPWWDASRLRNGTLWDDPAARQLLLYDTKLSHHGLIKDVEALSKDLARRQLLPKALRRRLLILSLLIAYLEDRQVLRPRFFGCFRRGARRFFHVLGDGDALVELLSALETKFNGNVFALSASDRDVIRGHGRLAEFAQFIEGRTERGGQLTLWRKYSFRDLPVELLSHIYQLFVKEEPSSVYTPPFLVRLMLAESLGWERLDRLMRQDEVILDPCCGSGVFLVEAYKRLILYWRAKNQWQKPTLNDLRRLLLRVWGVDLEPGAIELAAFSLCLALCDALDVKTIRASRKLLPPLVGETLHESCFFEGKAAGLFSVPVGAVIGNPPFESRLRTEGARASCRRYETHHGTLPDMQVAYLFLYESMELLQRGGVLCLLQQYNLLYNQQPRGFRRAFFGKWDVREVLDFVSIRGLFHKGKADTKVVVIVAEADSPPPERLVLHATFRRTGRVDAEQGFDIDYYDLHWLPRELALEHDGIWRSDLLGGGRVLGFVERLKAFRTLAVYVRSRNWDCGEGFAEGATGAGDIAEHITGKAFLPSVALGPDGIDDKAITIAPPKPIVRPRSESRFTPPMLLVREQMDLPHDVWTTTYLTYGDQLVGICAPKGAHEELEILSRWLRTEKRVIRAYVAATSTKLFTKRATSVSHHDIFAIPYPEGTLDLGPNEQIIVDDIVDYYRDLARLGEDSAAMKPMDVIKDSSRLDGFVDVYTKRIGAIYRKKLRALRVQTWPGIICQPFVFGKGEIDWSGSEELRGKLSSILQDRNAESLHVTRIARIYDGAFIFLLKPNRVRYWLKSVALRDADETLADLREQGF